ncbi:hypothetical protein ACLMJK_006824 [Lecanora helva]
MQIASILSDLTSLRVCDHSAALALVSVHKQDASSSTNLDRKPISEKTKMNDVDMQRVTDLMDLHHGVKIGHVRGEDAGLKQAREDIDRVIQNLERNQNEDKN